MQESGSEDWKKRLAPWLDYVQQNARLFEAARSIPLGSAALPCDAPVFYQPSAQPVKILIAAPHPDDEALIGALPLRWRMEAGAHVTNCAITLGGKASERGRRASELRNACRVLGFGLIIPGEEGFNDVTLQDRREAPEEWAAKVEALRAILDAEEPDLVLVPHAEDFHTTHIGTHYLVVDALAKHLQARERAPLPLIETEFWHELSAPNLMVAVSPEIVAIQIMATAEHRGEVSRNPHHLRFPARLMDNVRRGSEVVGGQGAPAKSFAFAELYRVTFMRGGERVQPRPGGRVLGLEQELSIGWLRSEFWPEQI